MNDVDALLKHHSVELFHCLEALYLLLHLLQLGSERRDRGVDANVGVHELLEVLESHALGLGRVIVLFLDELHLGLVGCVDLAQFAVLLVLEEVELSGFFDSLEPVVDILLLLLVDAGNLRDLLILDLVLGLGLFHELGSPLERFSELDQLIEELIMLLLFFSELVVEVFVQLLLGLFPLD